MNNAYLIFSGLILGAILYQTVFVAPTVFKTIDNVNTSKFLRKIFPRFFMFILFLGITALIDSILNSRGRLLYTVYSVTSLFSLFAFLTIPMTNKATDDNDRKKFKMLHSLSVVLTVIILIINFIPFFN
tara:strand:+ start:2048 stop:2434 length:387 start_codon:yes stop_codon:yes gene_type:complete